ncbi:glycosyltransferase [Agarivorans sp.]|uniref:glycosyltransferase n=1 Tax=Agarivorans sp. TaxID=1872412 RepID=UPI003CFCCC70
MSNKPRIIVFSNQLLNYSETFIRAQGEALQQFSAFYLGSSSVSQGISLPLQRRYIIQQQALGKLDDVLLKLGILTPRIGRYVSKLTPSLIHAHFGPNGLTALPLAKRCQVPLITTFHGFDVTINQVNKQQQGRLHLHYMNNKHQLMEHGSLFIAVSDFIKNKLIAQGFAKHKIVRHYIGIDTRFFSPDETVQRKPQVTIVGRLVPYKGHRFLIAAMKLVQQSFDVELVFIGDGPEKAALQAQAKQQGVKLRLTGKCTPEQVRQHLRESLVYCQTSVVLDNGHEEALALSIAEAQAVGTPAVVFASGGMAEALLPNESGFVVPTGEITALADAISTLLKDRTIWRQFSQAAIRQVQQRHNLTKQCQALEQLYQQTIKQQQLQASALGSKHYRHNLDGEKL